MWNYNHSSPVVDAKPLLMRDMSSMCFPFGRFSVELRLYFLKYLLRSRQFHSFHRLVEAFHKELSPYVLVVQAVRKADPLKFPRLTTIDLKQYSRNPMPGRWATNRPIRILSLSKLQDINQDVQYYRDFVQVEYLLERLLHGQWATVVNIHESTSKTFQSYLRKVCIRNKCPLLVIYKQLPLGASGLFDSRYSIDCSYEDWFDQSFGINHDHTDDGHEPTMEAITNPGKILQVSRSWSYGLMSALPIHYKNIPMACYAAKAVEITNCPSMDKFLILSTNTEKLSIQLNDECHMLQVDHNNTQCINPTIKIRAPHLKTLELFFSGDKHPVIECDHLAFSDHLTNSRLFCITNTDFSDDTPVISGCQHAEGLEPDRILPAMHFTGLFSFLHYNGVGDSFLKLTSCQNAQSLRWRRSSSMKAYHSSTQNGSSEPDNEILVCPALIRLTIISAVSKDDPITVSFYTPEIRTLELLGLEGGDTGWDVLRILDHQNEGDNPELDFVKLQLATDDQVLLPLEQVEPFHRSLKHLSAKGYSIPWIWSWNGRTKFERLISLGIDISHIPFNESVSGGHQSSIYIDFSGQFPSLEQLDIRARLNHHLRFCGESEQGIDLGLKTCKQLNSLILAPAIKTRSVRLNGKLLDLGDREPALTPYYVRVWNFLSGDEREYRRSIERQEFGDSLRYW